MRSWLTVPYSTSTPASGSSRSRWRVGRRGMVAVEGDRLSGADLEWNARTVGLTEGAMTTALDSVERYLAARPSSSPRVETAIVDPPRTGISGEAMALLLKRAIPRMVYVSCDPATMARDARRLLDGGYHRVAARVRSLPQYAACRGAGSVLLCVRGRRERSSTRRHEAHGDARRTGRAARSAGGIGRGALTQSTAEFRWCLESAPLVRCHSPALAGRRRDRSAGRHAVTAFVRLRSTSRLRVKSVAFVSSSLPNHSARSDAPARR